VGHFIEVHFVFSIAATYTYFWVYAGLLVALSRIRNLEWAGHQEATPRPGLAEAEQRPEIVTTTRRSKKRRGRRASVKKKPAAVVSGSTRYLQLMKRESWETWVGSQGLAMAIILIILTFDFVTPQFEFSIDNEKSTSLFWMMSITWLIGFAIAISNLAVRRSDWPGRINWGRATMLYAITSLSYFFFYILAHRFQFGQRITVQVLLFLMGIIAVTLSWRSGRRLTFWRPENWWLYPPLVLAILTVIWFKNMNVVRADIYLKEGERYRGQKQWNEAIALHERGRVIDSDEDFYYLMLALDYQLMAQDGNLDPNVREHAWQEGERIALEARNINPYNPDNTGNMGRYYFTLGQIFNPEQYQNALDFFEKATILAPSNVIYHNLWAQTYYILQNYEAAVDRLQTSVAIDPLYSPSWLLLGDTYAAMGNVDQALVAHGEAMKLRSRGSGNGFASFADQFLDQRLNFYVSAGRSEDVITTLQGLDFQGDPRVPWMIGHIHNLQGQRENAIPYFEEARALGDNSGRTIRELASIYLALNEFEKALPIYQLLLDQNANEVESHSALAFIYAKLGNLPKAIEHNLAVIGQLAEDYDSWKNLALLYRDNGQLPEAIEAAHRAQAAAPEAEAPSWSTLIAELENQLAAND
jgi:tetratricopeptide (TPR) repeat protein